ncbi:histidine phosphatase superfamily [Powellomyces hirtus]|nr:histidine phosphatase superfamily [Powellomyces hirtus]
MLLSAPTRLAAFAVITATAAAAAPVKQADGIVNIELPPYFRTMGGFTPWAPNVKGYGIKDDLPEECVVDQVSQLMRHGMRYASTGTGGSTEKITSRIRNSTFEVLDPKLAFLKTHVYGLQTELLSDWGKRESHIAGQTFAKRYQALTAQAKRNILVRTTDQERMYSTALSFAQGYLGPDQAQKTNWLVVPDAIPTFNTTLAVGNCKAHDLKFYGPVAGVLPSQWAAQYLPPIAARLNALLPGLHLVDNEVASLLSGCPFETIHYNKISPLCLMFTPEEFANYSYYQDLQQYTGAGYGGPLGRARGVGWVNEVIARLTDRPVNDATSTNTTLDSDPATFPLRQPVYLDFAHDSELNSAIAVMGLLKDTPSLSGTVRNDSRLWQIPNIAEMGGRLWVERIQCTPKPSKPGKCQSQSTQQLSGTFVRQVLNHAVLPLDIAPCNTNPERAKSHGLCKLADFVESQVFAQNGGTWKNCDHNSLDEWKAAGSPM